MTSNSFIRKTILFVDDTVTYFYLDTMARLFGVDCLAHFIPASNGEGIPVMANLLFGWKIDFGVLTFDNQAGKRISNVLEKAYLHKEIRFLTERYVRFQDFQK